MISPAQALTAVGRAALQEQGRLDDLDGQLDDLRRQLGTLMQQRGEQLKALARLRLDVIDDGGAGLLDAAEQAAAALLDERDRAAEDLAQRIDTATRTLKQLEQQHAAQAERVHAAGEELEQAEAATRARLEADADWQAQMRKAREAERVARHAAEKADESTREQGTKGAAYEADPLFMYLWRCGYGTDDYKSHGLIRWLDGKVAGLIGYADARPGYRRLLEIAPRLREHARHMQHQAAAELAALNAFEQAAAEADGILPLEQALADAERVAAESEQRVEAAQRTLDGLLAERAAYAAGDDPKTRKAVERLARALASRALADLEQRARATPYPEDDAIVETLADLEEQQRRVGHLLDNLKQSRARQQERFRDLSRIKHDMRRRGMERAGGRFADEGVVAMMIERFIEGLLDRDALLAVLDEQYRYRPPRTPARDPFAGYGGGWSGRSGSRSGGFRSGGGFGGGGFRSGGGFGGGGFRTGGGF